MAARVRASELTGGIKWLNSKPLTLKELKGKVVLVDFWTYTCVNCLRTLPFIKEWHNRYQDSSLVIIGVHTPEFTFEKEEENVSRFIQGSSFVQLTEPKMYNLLNNLDLNSHVLKMRSNSDQWETYAFTFGACTKKAKAA